MTGGAAALVGAAGEAGPGAASAVGGDASGTVVPCPRSSGGGTMIGGWQAGAQGRARARSQRVDGRMRVLSIVEFHSAGEIELRLER